MTQTAHSDPGSYVLPAFERATVADVMRPGVMSCAPDAPLLTVAQTMATHHVHAVVVAGVTKDDAGGDHLIWGLVSDMDIVRAAGSGIEGHMAADAARTELVSVDPSTPLADAARLMDEHHGSHLIVTSEGHPVGVLSSLDIAGVLAWGRA
ncbi:MAG TPA: CBS domain-containing protein [Solirubrobacteraceae bacterium]|nr:CBS domain-containing protein [Solirubrobacteraceae bacterium]